MEFTRAKYLKLKRAYQSAMRQGKMQFTFEGQEVLVAYAKYLIEYLAMRFGK